VLTHKKPVSEITDRIDAGYYAAIELFDAWEDGGLAASRRGDMWPDILAAVARRYREVAVNRGPSSFWVRKGPGAG
jgi:hypothetical protein